MSFKDHDEINYDEYLSLSDLAYEVRWAALVVNAALPLAPAASPASASQYVTYDGDAEAAASLAEARLGDRSQLRALAFEHVLAQLSEFDFKVPPADADALLAGRMPPTTGNLEA
jgi:hypothetical protein